MMSPSLLARCAGIVLVMVLAAGCPSSSGERGDPGAIQAVPVEKPSGKGEIETAAGPHVEPVDVPDVGPPDESAVLPNESDAPPMVGPVPAVAEPAVAELVEPSPPLTTNADGGSNPLRGGNGPRPIYRWATNPKVRGVRHGSDLFDPIKENGPIFVGWPDRAKLAMVITGRQDGYIEPCGCAGLGRMKGGMSRRHALFKQLRAKGWPVVGIDVGGVAKGYGRQAVLKFHTMVEGMRQMGYDAIALGTSDLKLPIGELAAKAASVEGVPSPFLSANVALFGFALNMTAKTRIIEAGSLKLGITAVLGRQFQRQLQGDGSIELAEPEVALAAVVPQLKQEADYLILLAHATVEESTELARKFPDFDLVVTAGGAPTPPADPEEIQGSKALLIEVGEKGMDAIVLAMFDDPKQPFRYQRVPLDSRFPASSEITLLMTVYQEQLQREWSSGFAVAKIPHEQADLNGKFAGSRACQSCHEISYDVWKKSGHSKAYDTLAELEPSRVYDPECISCHVVGWHPQEHFPYTTGFATLEETPKLIDVGCESCHGPGGAHTAAEQGSDLALQEKLQRALVITKEESKERQCRTCHDLDNSPDFDFETYWPKVEHIEYEEQ